MANLKKGTSPGTLSKGLLQTPELYQYMVETSVYPREPQPLKDLRLLTTASHPRALQSTAPDAAQLISMLLKLINAKRTIEVGVFTGYSLLLTALTIPQDGQIVAIDKDRSAYEIGIPVIKKAGVEHKINFIQSEALPFLDHLLKDGKSEGSFDMAFVDADKSNYCKYHERMMKLVRVGGIIVYDSTLLFGSVVKTEEETMEFIRESRRAIIQFNQLLASDHNIHISQAPLGDGITICRREH